jgi:hypothetical protein
MSGNPSRRVVVVVGIVVAAFSMAGLVGAFWSTGSSSGGNGHASAGTLPTGSTPSVSLVSRAATVTWAQSNVAGSLLGQRAGGGYTVTRYAEGALTSPIAPGAACAGTHNGPSDPMSCTESSLPAGRWLYTVTPILFNWIGGESATTASQVVAPDSPISVALTNGAGAGNAFINTTNQTSLTFNVSLPATSLASDTVNLVLSDGIAVVAASAAGIGGGGVRTFTGVDASSLGEGPITISATVSSSYGDASTPVSIVRTKDTVGPTLVSLSMRDNNSNGKVDRVLATFSESLSAYSAGTVPWTLLNVPSGGTLASVSVSAAVATLTITEGAGAPDTAVGSFTVALATNAAGIRDAAGNLSSFAATAPADGARPVPVSVTSVNNGLAAGLMEVGDTVTVSFSETIASVVGPGTAITETDPSGAGNDRLTVAGLTAVAGVATGSNLYVVTDNTSASFASSSMGSFGAAVTATVAGACTGTCVANLAAGIGALVFTPDPSLADAAGNTATGSITTAATFRLF